VTPVRVESDILYLEIERRQDISAEVSDPGYSR
jgi:DNA-dependent RNA polymerase auxiliary subunit epsilon